MSDKLTALPGSDFYYACLYEETGWRRRLLAVHQLQAAICSIPIQASDPQVARLKLDWWHQTTRGGVDKHHRHPLIQEYLASGGAPGALAKAIAALTTGLIAELNGHILGDRNAQFQWFDDTYAGIYALQVGSEQAMFADGLGRWIEIGYSILNLRDLAMRGINRIPQSVFTDAGYHRDDIASARNPKLTAALVAHEAALAIDGINNITTGVSRRLRRRQRCLYTLGRIVCATLDATRRDGCRLWQHRIRLTPLQKLWLAWKAAVF